ncbi:MAG: DMT family transporter [Paracoccaceae bacterium]|nr:DMT family transporter [Paracoccaceae bacterium]
MANTRAILFMTAAMASFAVADALIKFVTVEIGVAQTIALVSFLGSLNFVPLILRSGEHARWRDVLHPTVILRTSGEVVAASAIVTSLALVPLSTLTVLFQAQPLALTLAAAVFLRESVGWRRWSAVAIGFLGVLIILQPGSAAFDAVLLIPLLGILATTTRDVATRLIPKEISTLFVSAWALLATSALAALAVPFFGGWQSMDGRTIVMILASSVAVTLSTGLITAALRMGEVSAVAPFRYTRLIFALTIAYVIFDERLVPTAWIGMALIVGSGLYAFWREQKLAAEAKRVSGTI